LADRWTNAVFSQILGHFSSIFTPMFNTRLTRYCPTAYQTLHSTHQVINSKQLQQPLLGYLTCSDAKQRSQKSYLWRLLKCTKSNIL